MIQVAFKCTDSNGDVHILGSNQVTNIKPIVSNDKQAYVIVYYYNDDFCISESLICENIEVMKF